MMKQGIYMHGDGGIVAERSKDLLEEIGPLSPEGMSLINGLRTHREQARECNAKSYFILKPKQNGSYTIRVTTLQTVQMIELMLSQLCRKKPIRLSYKSAVIPDDIPQISWRVPFPVFKGTRILHGIETDLNPCEISTFSASSLDAFIMQHNIGHPHIKPIELCSVLAMQFSSQPISSLLAQLKTNLPQFVYDLCNAVTQCDFKNSLYTFLIDNDPKRNAIQNSKPRTPYELSHRSIPRFDTSNLALSLICKIALGVDLQQAQKGVIYFIHQINHEAELNQSEHISLYMAYGYLAKRFDTAMTRIKEFLDAPSDIRTTLKLDSFRQDGLYTEHSIVPFNCIDGLTFPEAPTSGALIPWEPGTNQMCTLHSASFDDEDTVNNQAFMYC